MSNRKYISIIAVAVLFSGQAFADEYKGWVYNGLTGVGSVSQDDLSDNTLASNSSIGYRWGKLGIEVGHAYFGKFEDSTEVSGSSLDVDTSVAGWNLGLTFNHNLDKSSKWSLQGRVGVFDWSADGHVASGPTRIAFDDSGNDWYAGASIDYRWRKRSSVGLGYTWFKADQADLSVWGLHTEFRF
jgi:hypothetical protein